MTPNIDTPASFAGQPHTHTHVHPHPLTHARTQLALRRCKVNRYYNDYLINGLKLHHNRCVRIEVLDFLTVSRRHQTGLLPPKALMWWLVPEIFRQTGRDRHTDRHTLAQTDTYTQQMNTLVHSFRDLYEYVLCKCAPERVYLSAWER